MERGTGRGGREGLNGVYRYNVLLGLEPFSLVPFVPFGTLNSSGQGTWV